jgi:hypothetical protein
MLMFSRIFRPPLILFFVWQPVGIGPSRGTPKYLLTTELQLLGRDRLPGEFAFDDHWATVGGQMTRHGNP